MWPSLYNMYILYILQSKLKFFHLQQSSWWEQCSLLLSRGLHLSELDVLLEALGSAPVGGAYGAPGLALGLPVLGETTANSAAAGGTSPASAAGRHTILLQAGLLTKLILLFNLEKYSSNETRVKTWRTQLYTSNGVCVA